MLDIAAEQLAACVADGAWFKPAGARVELLQLLLLAALLAQVCAAAYFILIVKVPNIGIQATQGVDKAGLVVPNALLQLKFKSIALATATAAAATAA
jgi:hypothetical protein